MKDKVVFSCCGVRRGDCNGLNGCVVIYTGAVMRDREMGLGLMSCETGRCYGALTYSGSTHHCEGVKSRDVFPKGLLYMYSVH